jgi:hypothetical protein
LTPALVVALLTTPKSTPMKSVAGRRVPSGAAELARMVGTQATTLAYSDLWSIASLIVLALVPVIFLLDLRPAPAAK